MTERLEDVRRHLTAIDEIGDVVGALRAIASARTAEARGTLAAISTYERQVAHALARLTASAVAEAAPGPGLVLVVGAAQGFCGAYPARVAEVAQAAAPDAGLLVIGQRTAASLAAAGRDPLWTAELPAASAQVPALASQVTDRLLDLGARHPGPILAVTGTGHPGQPPVSRRIWPLERELAGTSPGLAPPLTTLPRAELVRELLAETLYAQVARTLVQGMLAEAQARIEAMARAQGNLKTRRADFEQRLSQARQEQMTTEVIELSSHQEAR